jgi:hypothetical protein
MADVYQIYIINQEKINKGSYQGFGDFIRGCIYLYQESLVKKYNLKICFNHHHLSKIFKCNTNLTLDECQKLQYYRDIKDPIEAKYIFCSRPATGKITKECKDFIIENCLTPLPEFNEKLLNYKDYIVIHFRTADKEKDDEKNILSKIKTKISYIKKINQKKKIFIIGSNQKYLEQITDRELLKTNLKRGHTGLNSSFDEIEGTMIEFMLLTKADKIYQISIYPWGSNFSDIANKIFDVPIEKIKI